MAKPDGGAAFPGDYDNVFIDQSGHDKPFTIAARQKGMSLRDYFAGQALNALMTSALLLDHKSWDATAQHAYFVADAMLKAREAD